MNNSAKEIIEVLTKAERPIICMDSRVDFDALCSAIIMRNFLMDICKREVRVTLDRELKDNIKKITGDYTDISFVEENVCPTTDIDFSKYDLSGYPPEGNSSRGSCASCSHCCKSLIVAGRTFILCIILLSLQFIRQQIFFLFRILLISFSVS